MRILQAAVVVPLILFTAATQAAGPGPGNDRSWLSLSEVRPLPIQSGEGAVHHLGGFPLSLCSGDFDRDGVADLVSGFASGPAGTLRIHLGNEEAIYPRGEAPPAVPLRAPSVVVDAPAAPDFLIAGDFDNDGKTDVVTAARGERTLYLLAGDGAGGLKNAVALELPGELRALVTGEVNRADGLPEIVAATESVDGPAIHVFESPEGAWRAKLETIALPGSPTSVVIADVNRDTRFDLAVTTKTELVVVEGRDRRLSLDSARRAAVSEARIEKRALSFEPRAMTFGDFSGRRLGELAILDDNGSVHLVGHNLEETVTGVADVAGEPMLLRARVSNQNGDDLVVIDRAGDKLLVLAGGTLEAGCDGHAGPRRAMECPTMRSRIELGGPAAAVLPMRLNPDALSDLVVLRDDPVSPLTYTESTSELIYTVTNTDDSGPGSLRRAISSSDVSFGADSIHFAIPGSGPHTISLLSPLPQITDTVTIDGWTQPGFAETPVIVLDGTSAGPGAHGLEILSGGSTVRGLAIGNFQGDGIRIEDNGGNLIEGNFIGTDASGTTTAGNRIGLIALGSSGNTIGGAVAAARNVISGNAEEGVAIMDWIKWAPSSDTPMPIPDLGLATSTNSIVSSGVVADVVVSVEITHTFVADLTLTLISPGGIRVTLSDRNGGSGDNYSHTQFDDMAARSITDGEPPFVYLFRPEGWLGALAGTPANGDWTLEVTDSAAADEGIIEEWDLTVSLADADYNLVEGNYIGTNAAGTAALQNGQGIDIYGDSNVIGGTTAPQGNLISGNLHSGVYVADAANLIQGNLLGTDATGAYALVNEGEAAVYLVHDSNSIGGTAPGAGNVIVGGDRCVQAFVVSDNLVQGNLIGTDATGTVRLGTSQRGVFAIGGVGNWIGGSSAGAGNLIAGHTVSGIRLATATSDDGLAFRPSEYAVQGNWVGIHPGDGGTWDPMLYGVAVEGHDNVVGGPAAGSGNVISANGTGVLLAADSVSNEVSANRIGTDGTGTLPRGNETQGVMILGKQNRVVENVISANGGNGVTINTYDEHVLSSSTSGGEPMPIPDAADTVSWVNVPFELTISDVDVEITIEHARLADLVIHLLAPDGTPVLLSENNGGDGDNYDGTTFDDEAGTWIFDGTPPFTGSFRPQVPLAQLDGKAAVGSWGLAVADVAPGEGGAIVSWTLWLEGVPAQDNVISDNIIGTDPGRTLELGNGSSGVWIGGPSNHVTANVIADSGDSGVTLSGRSALGNELYGNVIGTPSGEPALGNGSDGVRVEYGISGPPRGNRIGHPEAPNIIITNGGAGVRVVDGSSQEIRGNSIVGNGGLGIDLGEPGVDPNDTEDADTGANGLQNHPMLQSVTYGEGSTVIEGPFHGQPHQQFWIDFYGSEAGDPSGYGEGEYYLGSTSLETDAFGDAWVWFEYPGVALFPSATATGADGSTSEFSGVITNLQEAEDMLLTPGPAGEIQIDYTPACGATDHVVYYASSWGPLPGGINWTDAACFLGATGTAVFEPGEVPPGSLVYFVIVGQNYLFEGSYGESSYGAERPEAIALGACERSRLISPTCP